MDDRPRCLKCNQKLRYRRSAGKPICVNEECENHFKGDCFSRYRERSKPGGTLSIPLQLYGQPHEKINYECDGFKVIQNGCNKYDSVINCTRRYLDMLDCDKYSYDKHSKNVHLACEKDGFLLCLVVSKPHPQKSAPSPDRETYRYLWDWRHTPGPHPKPPSGHGRGWKFEFYK